MAKAIAAESGAVDLANCPTRLWVVRGRNRGRCYCGPCAVCGNPKHTAIHGPSQGQPPGSKPWGHEYQPVTEPHTPRERRKGTT